MPLDNVMKDRNDEAGNLFSLNNLKFDYFAGFSIEPTLKPLTQQIILKQQFF